MAILRTQQIVYNGLIFAVDSAYEGSYTSGSTIWYDLSSNSYTSSIVGTPPISSSNSLYFAGTSSQYVTIESRMSNIIANTNNITIGSWVYTTSNVADEFVVYFNSTGATGWLMEYTSGKASIQFGNGTTNIAATDPNTSLNQWNYVVATYDGSLIKLYRNGILVQSSSQSGNLPNVTNTPIYIAAGNSAARYWNGLIANVHFYNRALTSTEILQNYNAHKSRFGL
jgi:hypothetical protein